VDPIELRQAYDHQLRAWMPPHLPPGATVERDGPLLRLTGLDGRGFVTYVDLAGVRGPELDALIARQRDHFVARGEAVEWKLHGHDEPADLPERLRAAGFVPEEQETVVIGRAAPLVDARPPLPDGVILRELAVRADLDRLDALEGAVWGGRDSGRGAALAAELAADPTGTTVVSVEEPDGDVVCAGWVRYVAGTPFATLWGGSTLPRWRGRGIYRAVVAYRAWLAMERGYEYLQVDASDNSRPILERCGLVAVTTTTPYVYSPGVSG
jgi:GNAT superfamily N-acetyltransferase